jgi:hypothetical protein
MFLEYLLHMIDRKILCNIIIDLFGKNVINALCTAL